MTPDMPAEVQPGDLLITPAGAYIHENETWRYTYGGNTKHFLNYPRETRAWCGVGVIVSSDWRGTGTQDEYERLEAMPKCKRCLKLLKRI